VSIGVCVCVCVCVRVYVCVCVCVYLSRAEYVCDTTRRTIGVSCVCVCVCVTNSMSWQHDSRPWLNDAPCQKNWRHDRKWCQVKTWWQVFISRSKQGNVMTPFNLQRDFDSLSRIPHRYELNESACCSESNHVLYASSCHALNEATHLMQSLNPGRDSDSLSRTHCHELIDAIIQSRAWLWLIVTNSMSQRAVLNPVKFCMRHHVKWGNSLGAIVQSRAWLWLIEFVTTSPEDFTVFYLSSLSHRSGYSSGFATFHGGLVRDRNNQHHQNRNSFQPRGRWRVDSKQTKMKKILRILSNEPWRRIRETMKKNLQGLAVSCCVLQCFVVSCNVLQSRTEGTGTPY